MRQHARPAHGREAERGAHEFHESGDPQLELSLLWDERPMWALWDTLPENAGGDLEAHSGVSAGHYAMFLGQTETTEGRWTQVYPAKAGGFVPANENGEVPENAQDYWPLEARRSLVHVRDAQPPGIGARVWWPCARIVVPSEEDRAQALQRGTLTPDGDQRFEDVSKPTRLRIT